MRFYFFRTFSAFSPILILIILITTVISILILGSYTELAAKDGKGGDPLGVIYPSSQVEIPIIKFSDDQGNEVTLEKFRETFVMLHFWAIWCTPCRKELPTMDRLQNNYSEENFIIIPLSVGRDDAEDVYRFYLENNIVDLPIYIDPDMESARKMLITGIPFTILIDGKGREVGRIAGARDWSSPDIHALLKDMIQ